MADSSDLVTEFPNTKNYSGHHKIPNIKQFMDSLDRDKKARDAQIDQQQPKFGQTSEAVQHQSKSRQLGKNRRTVRDPVTGKDVEIDDMDGDVLKSVENPMVSRPYHTIIRREDKSGD